MKEYFIKKNSALHRTKPKVLIIILKTTIFCVLIDINKAKNFKIFKANFLFDFFLN